MESRQRSGLYGNGEVPRSRKLKSKLVGPKSVGLRDIRSIRPIRQLRPTRFHSKAIAAVVIGPIAATMAIAVVMLLGFSMVPVDSIGPDVHTDQVIPPPPYTLVGICTDDTGTPIGGVTLNVTNLRTGQSTVNISDLASGGFFAIDLVPISNGAWPLPGDQIRINATFAALSGTNLTAVPDPIGAFMWENVSLSVIVIPEFGEVALPIVGTLGIFAVVAMVARSKKDE